MIDLSFLKYIFQNFGHELIKLLMKFFGIVEKTVDLTKEIRDDNKIKEEMKKIDEVCDKGTIDDLLDLGGKK